MTPTAVMSDGKNIKLASLLKSGSIELQLKGKDKAKIISELVNVISTSCTIKNKKALTEALLERERLGSTAIGNGVAVPHAKIDGIRNPILAFGRSPEGVDFSALDGEKTHLFFIFISAKDDVGIHLKVLAKISHLIKDKFMVSLFKRAKSKKEILALIANLEKSLDR